MKTEARQRLLQQLKSGGPQTAAQLADGLGLSAMGVHKQLQQLADEGLLQWQDEAGAVGRPRRVWRSRVQIICGSAKRQRWERRSSAPIKIRNRRTPALRGIASPRQGLALCPSANLLRHAARVVSSPPSCQH